MTDPVALLARPAPPSGTPTSRTAQPDAPDESGAAFAELMAEEDAAAGDVEAELSPEAEPVAAWPWLAVQPSLVACPGIAGAAESAEAQAASVGGPATLGAGRGEVGFADLRIGTRVPAVAAELTPSGAARDGAEDVDALATARSDGPMLSDDQPVRPGSAPGRESGVGSPVAASGAGGEGATAAATVVGAGPSTSGQAAALALQQSLDESGSDRSDRQRSRDDATPTASTGPQDTAAGPDGAGRQSGSPDTSSATGIPTDDGAGRMADGGRHPGGGAFDPGMQRGPSPAGLADAARAPRPAVAADAAPPPGRARDDAQPVAVSLRAPPGEAALLRLTTADGALADLLRAHLPELGAELRDMGLRAMALDVADLFGDADDDAAPGDRPGHGRPEDRGAERGSERGAERHLERGGGRDVFDGRPARPDPQHRTDSAAHLAPAASLRTLPVSRPAAPTRATPVDPDLPPDAARPRPMAARVDLRL